MSKLECALSRLSCPLASAESVCWAKRNHSFFMCQHHRLFFFHRGNAVRLRRADMDRRCNGARVIAGAFARMHRSAENQQQRGLHRCECNDVRITAITRAIAPSTRHHSKTDRSFRARGRRGRRNFSRCTTRFAQECADIFFRSDDFRVVDRAIEQRNVSRRGYAGGMPRHGSRGAKTMQWMWSRAATRCIGDATTRHGWLRPPCGALHPAVQRRGSTGIQSMRTAARDAERRKRRRPHLAAGDGKAETRLSDRRLRAARHSRPAPADR